MIPFKSSSVVCALSAKKLLKNKNLADIKNVTINTMPEFNVLLVFSRNKWSFAQRFIETENVRRFYEGKLKINWIVRDEDFGAPVWDAPIIVRNTIDGGVSTIRYINEDWYDDKVTKYALKVSKQRGASVHCVVLCLGDQDWKGGWMAGNCATNDQGIQQIYLWAHEGDKLFDVPHETTFTSHLKHELRHFFCAAYGIPDDTHAVLDHWLTPTAASLNVLVKTGAFDKFRARMLEARTWWRKYWGIF
jgi:hypothetical protein